MPRSLRVITALDPDPGPEPRERRELLTTFPTNDQILKEEAVSKAWYALTCAVRATGDLDAVRAAIRFQIALENFLA